MRFVKKEKTEPRYFVPEIAQAIGVSEGVIHGYFRNRGEGREQISCKEGLTLDDIVKVIERKRTRGDGLDFKAIEEIRTRLINEKGYVLDTSDEDAHDLFDYEESLIEEAQG